jgi:hypothetical protein
MKINSPGTISISLRALERQIFRELQPGARISARVLERYGRHEALLDIGGTRMRAHFQGGVPGSGFLVLIMRGKSGDTLLFNIQSATSRTGFTEKLQSFFIFPLKNISPEASAAINRYLGSDPKSIFDLNMILAGQSRELRGEGLTAIFRSLSEKKDNPPWLFRLSLYLAGFSLGEELAHSLAALNRDEKKEGRKEQERKKHGKISEDEINTIAKEVDSMTDGQEKELLVRGIIEVLAEYSGPSGCIELPLADGDGYVPLKCLFSENSWIFQAEISKIGRIDIIARDTGPGFSIDIHAEDSPALEELKRAETDPEMLSGGGTIRVHDLKKSIDKLVAINDYFVLNSRFDTKA